MRCIRESLVYRKAIEVSVGRFACEESEEICQQTDPINVPGALDVRRVCHNGICEIQDSEDGLDAARIQESRVEGRAVVNRHPLITFIGIPREECCGSSDSVGFPESATPTFS